jgi:drug/metabolite transporter (DMT)-like permease
MARERESRSLAADLALAAITLVWGSTFIVNARVIVYEPPFAYLAFRFSIGALFLLFLARSKPRTPAIHSDAILLGVILGAGMAFQVAGQTVTSASKAAFITGLSVPLTPVVAYYRTRRTPGSANLAGIVLAAVGFGLLSWPTGGGPINRGDLLVLGCALAWALYIVENADRSQRHSPLLFSALQVGCASVTLGVFTFFFRLLRPNVPFTSFEIRPLVFDRDFWIAVAYMTVFATLISFTVQTWAQTKMSATHAALIFALEPVWAAILAAIFLAERLGTRGFLGGGLVVLGIVVSELKWDRLRRRD